MRFGFVKRILFIATLLSGCAIAPPEPPEISQPGTAAKARLGPEIELLNLPIKETKAVMDRNGHAHVLAVDSKSRDLHYLVIGPEGVTNREIVRSLVSYSNFDVAFDYEGHLHVVIDEDHLVREEGVWRAPQKGAPCLRLVRAGKDLVCAFIVSGEKVGSPGRWNWHGVFGRLPWYSHADKLVIARETPAGWSDWTVLDSDTELEARVFAIATDDLGTVHISYVRQNATYFSPIWELAYAQLEPTAPRAGLESKASASGEAETPRAPAAVSGRTISSNRGVGENFIQMEERQFLYDMDVAAGRESGTMLIVSGRVQEFPGHWTAFMVHHGGVDPPVPFLRDEGFLKVFHDPHLAPAGRDRFHAIVTWSGGSGYRIYYLTVSDGTWSTPVQLGKVKWLSFKSQSQLVSDRLGHALAIWPNEDKKLVARWIELMQ